MEFKSVRAFLESWGLHFDTPDGVSTTIPYPQVYERMMRDVINMPASKADTFKEVHQVGIFIRRITETTDGETYLAYPNWKAIEQKWDEFGD